MGAVTRAERDALQAFYQRAAEGRDRRFKAREGEALWHTPGPSDTSGRQWTPPDIESLEDKGLITIRREWKDNFVRVTEAGYAVLAGSEAPDEA